MFLPVTLLDRDDANEQAHDSGMLHTNFCPWIVCTVKKGVQTGTQREFKFVSGLKKEKGVKSWGKSSSTVSPTDWVRLLMNSQR